LNSRKVVECSHVVECKYELRHIPTLKLTDEWQRSHPNSKKYCSSNNFQKLKKQKWLIVSQQKLFILISQTICIQITLSKVISAKRRSVFLTFAAICSSVALKQNTDYGY